MTSELRRMMAKIALVDLELFLKKCGWRIGVSRNEKIVVYYKEIDDQKIEIVLAKNKDYLDYFKRIQDAIRILSIVEEINPLSIIDEIESKTRDIFRLRIPTIPNQLDISLRIAAREIESLKNLFGYGACSEKTSLPNYKSMQQIGQYFIESCKFGHTFKGSFGFTIISPMTIASNIQLSLFHNLVNREKPFERRVMERIIRSIWLLRQSIERDDTSIIVDNFDVGMNARMCDSLREISVVENNDVEFSVGWSPKVDVSDDIRTFRSWNIPGSAGYILEKAADELRSVEPFDEEIIGQVITLHSSKSPMSDGSFARHVTIRHDFQGKIINVKLYLDRDNYAKALDAHRSGLPIKVSGKLYKRGSIWKMVEVNEVILPR